MRLWHKDLISVLPRHQLLGQWRECCAISTNIIFKGTPNHMLVDKIMDYPPSHFNVYSLAVAEEMKRRGYRCDVSKFTRYTNENISVSSDISIKDIFPNWHNMRYLIQCYHNLEEKYDCGGITQEEWEKIDDLFWLEVERKYK